MKFIIRGGKNLSGEIAVKGAKNAVLKAMAAALLFENPVVLKNVPEIEDVLRMGELLEGIGAVVIPSPSTSLGINFAKESDQNGHPEPAEGSQNTSVPDGILRSAQDDAERRRIATLEPLARNDKMLTIDPRGVAGGELDKEIAKRLRASIVLVGTLLARIGKASFPYPGGCVIGKRPIDVFLDGWRAMGVQIKEKEGNGFSAETKGLRGADYTFRVVSVSGTETLLMTAALAEGKTTLRNAALEPEIPALAGFLNASGALIRGAGTPTIEIEGTGGKLLRAAESFTIIPDRIEAGSFLILGAALGGGGLKVSGCEPEHLTAVLAALGDAGAELEVDKEWVGVKRPKKMRAVNIQTREYPGFPTDLQAPFAVLMTQAEGESMVFETIFESRFGYAEDLKRMGANIFLADPHRIVVKGPSPLRGRDIESPDLRSGLAFVVAALLAKGESVIRNVYQIDRGYEKVDGRLRALGADIKRIN